MKSKNLLEESIKLQLEAKAIGLDWIELDKIIDKIRFYGAKLNGTGVTTPTDFIVERGTSGCLVFERV